MCATPLGNLEDVSLRLLRTLAECAVVAAEDTRTTRKLLSHHDLHTPLMSCHQHSGHSRVLQLVDRMRRGEDVALVCNAGTPTISDPGAPLIEAAIEAGIDIVPVPGPAAVTAALSVAGMTSARFWFQGFLPRSGSARRASLKRLAEMSEGALVVYESPRRLGGTLSDLADALGDRRAAICRELTKKFEEVVRGRLRELAEWASAREVKGEVTLVIEPGREESGGADVWDEEDLRSALDAAVAEGMSVRDAVRRVVDECGAPRNVVYDVAQRRRG